MNVTCKFKKNQSLFNCFIEITDPRVGGRCTYTLFTIIVIVLCGLICGCDNWKSIAMMARARKRWLGQWIDLSRGVPSHQTLARVFSLINPFEFEQCLQNWMEEISDVVDGDVMMVKPYEAQGTRGAIKKHHTSLMLIIHAQNAPWQAQLHPTNRTKSKAFLYCSKQ